MSNSRRQIEAFLKTLEISGSVVDFGGLFWPVKGRTKTWDVPDYKIIDIKESRNGVKADFVCDLNRAIRKPVWLVQYDHAFCIEVTDHFWNPVFAFSNIRGCLKTGGILYVSSNFLFPHHTGFDCVRFTKVGLGKILTETGFEVLEVTPRFAVDYSLAVALDKESKVQYHRGEVGYFFKAKKL